MENSRKEGRCTVTRTESVFVAEDAVHLAKERARERERLLAMLLDDVELTHSRPSGMKIMVAVG